MSFDPYFEWLGIPPEQQPPSHYLLLGLTPGESDPQQIRAAADSLLRSIRELRNDEHDEAARQIFTHVKQARACLLDEEQKRLYDRGLFGTAPPPPIPFDEPAELEAVAVPRPKSSRPGLGLLLGFLMGPITVAAVYFLVIKPGEVPQKMPQEALPPAIASPDPQPPAADDTEDHDTSNESRPVNLDRLRGAQSPRRSPQAASNPTSPPTVGPLPSTLGNSNRRTDDPNPANAASTLPGNLSPATQSARPAPLPKIPRPDEADLERARRPLRELYDQRIFVAREADAKQALAIELMGTVRPGQGSPAESYAALELAIELATAAGSLELTDRAISRLTSIFDESDLPHRAKAAKDWAAIISKDYRGDEKKSRQAHLAIIATFLAEEAGRRNANEIATDMYRLASSQSKYSGDDSRSRELFRLAQNFERLARERTEAEPLIAAALADPADPEKNDAAALALCFQLKDWDAGMSFLARGSDETLKQLALRDLENPEEVPPRIQLADDWWAAADTAPRDHRPAMQNRSVGIYESVYDDLQGLELAKAISRMKAAGPVTITLPSPRIHFDFEPKSISTAGQTATLSNRVGKVATGLLQGAALKKGLNGNALLMNGADHFVECPGTTHVIGADEEFTLSVWINPQLQKFQDIAGKFATANDAGNRDFGLYLESNNVPMAIVCGPNSSYSLTDRGDAPVSLGDWTHLVMTWDRSRVRLYVNGQNPNPVLPDTGLINSIGTSHDFTVGGMHRPRIKSRSNRFAGAIDELRLYARHLKPVEVMYLHLIDAP